MRPHEVLLHFYVAMTRMKKLGNSRALIFLFEPARWIIPSLGHVPSLGSLLASDNSLGRVWSIAFTGTHGHYRGI